jgi:hypothetical protein
LFVQTPLKQSDGALQERDVSQGRQVAPPQSTSLSSPSSVASVQRMF